MTVSELNTYLKNVTPSEQWHIDHPGELSLLYKRIPQHLHNGETLYYFDFSESLSHNLVAIIKESRFTYIPMHYHKDLEINYVYSGTCTYTISGNTFTLHEGDFLILDSDVHHCAPNVKTENDIVINFIITKYFFNSSFLNLLQNGTIITQFIFDSIDHNKMHDKFLLFHTLANERILPLIQYCLCEYFSVPALGITSKLYENDLKLIFL